MRGTDRLAPERLWRLPAALSTIGFCALAAWPFLGRFASGTPARGALAFILAIGGCSMLLGLGLGAWITIRLRSVAAALAGLWAVLVALSWWVLVFGPLLRAGRG